MDRRRQIAALQAAHIAEIVAARIEPGEVEKTRRR
jgi:hypothetical protein